MTGSLCSPAADRFVFFFSVDPKYTRREPVAGRFHRLFGRQIAFRCGSYPPYHRHKYRDRGLGQKRKQKKKEYIVFIHVLTNWL